MVILITGAFGFVGGRLAQYLSQKGHEVILSTREVPKSVDWLPGVSVRKTVWDSSEQLLEICQGVDVVIHAAGVDAQNCALNPVYALEFNGVSTLRLVRAAKTAGVKRFLYISTAHVYSPKMTGIISEETCPSNLHPYATSHLSGEHAVLCESSNEFDGIVVRLSNAFGVPTHNRVSCWTLLVNDLCMQAAQFGKMVLRSNGKDFRDFISLHEVSRIVDKLISSPKHYRNKIFNIGSGRSMSVIDMARLIGQRCKIIGLNPDIIIKEALIEVQDASPDFIGLQYRTDNLMQAKIRVDDNPIEEIDRLVAYCIEEHF